MQGPLRILILSCLISGCSHRLGDLSVMSNRNVSTPNVTGAVVEGSDCAFFLFDQPNLEEAVDDAMRSVPRAQYLINVTVHSRSYPFVSCVEVRGTLAAPKRSEAVASDER